MFRTLIALAAAALCAPAQALQAVPVVTGLDNPWALAWLPDGRMLVTEKPGRLRIVGADGKPGAPLAGLPSVDAKGQCGLLDVAVDPNFARTRTIYFTFAEPGLLGNSTAVGRARLDGDRLADVRTIFSQSPRVSSNHHCGSRIAITKDGSLLVGLGDRFSRKDEAQNPENQLGKVVRVKPDGSGFEVWSLGHRNIQGAALNPETGELWASEHGPQGGDEINIVERGKNYGWPLLTFGRNYGSGTKIGEEGPRKGYEQPLKVWVPSIAPSGMAWLTSERYPGWKGSLFVGALRGQALVRLVIEDRKVVGEERLFTTLGERIRDVRQGPDGYLYLVTDGSKGQILRVMP